MHNKTDVSLIPPGMAAIVAATKAIANDPAVAIDQPWSVVRLMVLDSMKMFRGLVGRPPRLLCLPKVVEVAIEVDMGRTMGEHQKLRSMPTLFGCKVVWDAAEFRVE